MLAALSALSPTAGPVMAGGLILGLFLAGAALGQLPWFGFASAALLTVLAPRGLAIDI